MIQYSDSYYIDWLKSAIGRQPNRIGEMALYQDFKKEHPDASQASVRKLSKYISLLVDESQVIVRWSNEAYKYDPAGCTYRLASDEAPMNDLKVYERQGREFRTIFQNGLVEREEVVTIKEIDSPVVSETKKQPTLRRRASLPPLDTIILDFLSDTSDAQTARNIRRHVIELSDLQEADVKLPRIYTSLRKLISEKKIEQFKIRSPSCLLYRLRR